MRNDLTIAREEIFGPVITPSRSTTRRGDRDRQRFDTASTYVWSGDSARATARRQALRTGTGQINGAPMHGDAPFGGYKMSGIGRAAASTL